MDGKLVGYLLLFSPLHYIAISGDGEVPITPESLSYLWPACCIKDCALSPHLNINGADRAPVCPGYLHSPCEGPRTPAASLNTVVVISGSSGRAGMWEVIQLGDWRHSASTIIIH